MTEAVTQLQYHCMPELQHLTDLMVFNLVFFSTALGCEKKRLYSHLEGNILLAFFSDTLGYIL